MMVFESKIKLSKNDFELVRCAIPHGSVLRPLLFLLYENGMQLVANQLDTTMFGDETNLFYSDFNAKSLFSAACQVLKNIKLHFVNV